MLYKFIKIIQTNTSNSILSNNPLRLQRTQNQTSVRVNCTFREKAVSDIISIFLHCTYQSPFIHYYKNCFNNI